jgi:hypothetical protein
MSGSPGEKAPFGYRLEVSVKCHACGSEQPLYSTTEFVGSNVSELREFDHNFANAIEHVVRRNCLHVPMYIHVTRRVLSSDEYERMKRIKELHHTETSLEAWERRRRQSSENSEN